jgi:acyl-CoA reductase-like NAD-dependent aldehyde dehydrogenase
MADGQLYSMDKSIDKIGNWINNKVHYPSSKNFTQKFNPHTGEIQALLTESTLEDVDLAITSAKNAFEDWSLQTPVSRGKYLMEIARLMMHSRMSLAECVAIETGKSLKDALGEVDGAISQAEFFAGEGVRMYGKTLTSTNAKKHSHTIRKPVGVAGLIVPANTPIANVAWKIFPALICGNTVVLKASEDAPKIAILVAEITRNAGLPPGVLNVVQGTGAVAGAALVSHPKISLISFTGSTEVGKAIAQVAGFRLARVSLELGGKNPFVICDDADIDQAVHWATLSAFSNAGQRCAAASRIIIFQEIYEIFKIKFIEKTVKLRLGVLDDCDVGPVINKRQQLKILQYIGRAINEGGNILAGGSSPQEVELENGYYINPTIIENISVESEFAKKEIFGPAVSLHKVKNLNEAIELSNKTNYGLTAAIHTKNVDRAMMYAHNVQAGVVNINIGTFGSEPHMPFGGFKDSGNGTREPGVEALDFYSELRNISYLIRDNLV